MTSYAKAGFPNEVARGWLKSWALVVPSVGKTREVVHQNRRKCNGHQGQKERQESQAEEGEEGRREEEVGNCEWANQRKEPVSNRARSSEVLMAVGDDPAQPAEVNS